MKDGETNDMGRGLSNYVRKSLGGIDTATKEMEDAELTAVRLYQTLLSISRGRVPTSCAPYDLRDLQDLTTDEVIDVIVEIVRPADGTLYAEAERSAIRESLYELLDDFPDAKLPELSAEQCLIATGYFVGICIYIRFRLDIGQNIQDRAPND